MVGGSGYGLFSLRGFIHKLSLTLKSLIKFKKKLNRIFKNLVNFLKNCS